jgi:hypothetical protein
LNLRRAIHPTHCRADGRLALADDERDAVDEQNKIGPARDGMAGPNRELRGDDAVVAGQVIEINQPDGGVLIVRAKGRSALAAQPGRELFVGAHQAITLHRKQDCPQAIQHFVGAVGPLGDFGIEADEGFAQVRFDQDIPFRARELVAGDVDPAEAGRGAGNVFTAVRACWLTRCSDWWAAEQVADEIFGVGFVEHGTSPLSHRRQAKVLPSASVTCVCSGCKFR